MYGYSILLVLHSSRPAQHQKKFCCWTPARQPPVSPVALPLLFHYGHFHGCIPDMTQPGPLVASSPRPASATACSCSSNKAGIQSPMHGAARVASTWELRRRRWLMSVETLFRHPYLRHESSQ
ncbi:hypothetical protein J1614_009289 [Plenodomus biglobosus]|nr:hypothetical protein J1614_009289 [Plenodomus biglobosus]